MAQGRKSMSTHDGHQKRIIRNLPDITAARQEESTRQFRDIVLHFNKQMTRLGLCDGNNCKHHQIIPGTGTGRDICRCRRATNAKTVEERKYWERMHYENCSAGRSMEKNLGCRGFEMEGAPLYQQKIMGRRVI